MYFHWLLSMFCSLKDRCAPTHHIPTKPPTYYNNHRIGNFPGVARASCFKGLLPGFTQSKQWRIELLYLYKRAKTSRIFYSGKHQELYLYLFILNCMFTLGEARQSIEKNYARATSRKSPIGCCI